MRVNILRNSFQRKRIKTNGSLWKIGCDKLLFDPTEIIEEGLSYVL